MAKLAVDVHYEGDAFAAAAGILFDDWRSDVWQQRNAVRIGSVRPYVPGRFFERELPCILELLARCAWSPSLVLVDGHATLGPDRRDGLGAHLHRALGSATPVIGIAKTRFADTPEACAVVRGRSLQPLFVTAVGIDEEEARHLVRDMHGEHRIPTVLKEVDRDCRAALLRSAKRSPDG